MYYKNTLLMQKYSFRHVATEATKQVSTQFIDLVTDKDEVDLTTPTETYPGSGGKLTTALDLDNPYQGDGKGKKSAIELTPPSRNTRPRRL